MTGPRSTDQALAELQSAAALVPDLSISVCRKLGTESAVFFGHLGTQPIVAKRFYTSGSDRVLRMKAELDAVTKAMAHTNHRINACLMALPDIGTIILDHAGDVRLSEALKAAGTQRAVLMAQAGSWLAAYVGDRRRVEPFRSRRWLDRLDELLSADTVIGDLSLVDRARKRLRQMGRELAGKPFTRAATHGDFVSINAHVKQGQIIGVDVQGEAWLPLARDVARFLVWQQLTDPGPAPLSFGISTADLQAMVPAVGLPSEEADRLLPFFIGLQLLQRLLDMRSDPIALENGISALRHWIKH